MKVLMVNTFNYMRGGAERCFLGLSNLFTANGHDVIPFCMHHPQNNPSPYDDYFVSHIDFPTALRENEGVMGKLSLLERVVYFREARQKIEHLIADTQPDIVHIHGIAHEISPSILPGIKKYNLPVVQTLHDYKLLCPNTNFVSQDQICERCRGHRYHNVIRYRCKRGSLPASGLAGVEMMAHKATQIYERHVDAFISPSRFLQEKVKAYGIRNRVENIPNFIDLADFKPVYEPEDYFLFLGRLVSTKGVRTLVQAMRQVRRSCLYIAGTGELEDELRQICEREGIENVRFLGHVQTADLIPLVQQARFTVVPSEWYENYSMSVLEAFACGTAVVGARIGGIPEQVLDGETGLLFESGNEAELAAKLNELLDDPERALAMGRGARAFVERNNSPESHYQATLSLYQSLIAS